MYTTRSAWMGIFGLSFCASQRLATPQGMGMGMRTRVGGKGGYECVIWWKKVDDVISRLRILGFRTVPYSCGVVFLRPGRKAIYVLNGSFELEWGVESVT